jgi:hypothetical protein
MARRFGRRRSRAHTLAATTLALVIAGAAGAVAPTDLVARSTARGAALEPNVVQGTVRTADGRPLAGAVIRVSGSTGAARGTTLKATTDARGNYRVAVPLGHYNVDGFVDLEYDGQTYRELWLDRVGAGCERVMSDRGIERHFVLRLSGPKRCFNVTDPNSPDAYHGAYVVAMATMPADVTVSFTFTPLGRLADGTAGRTLTFTRSGSALARGGGRLGETAMLHDIPLGRYRVTAETRDGAGRRTPLWLELSDGGGPAAASVDVSFPAYRMYPYGMRSVGLRLRAPSGADPRPVPDPVPPQPRVPVTKNPPDAPTGQALPVGRYVCSYLSPYAGEIPTANAVTVRDAARYEAYGASGTYAFDAQARTVRWISGPFAAAGVQASFGVRKGQPTITVIGGGAAEDPDRTNYCTLPPS